MIIGIDFDGTCTTHEFPDIGKDIGAVPVLKALVKEGHQLILFTMRSNIEAPVASTEEISPIGGNYLTSAINWFTANDIELYGIQTNPTQKDWTHSPKAYCHLYIDDAALGCPLVYPLNSDGRPYVDWDKVKEYLLNHKILLNGKT